MPDCIRSIFQNCFETGCREVVVIDNASTDGSAELVRTEFPEVRLISNRINTGFAAAVNQGMNLSSGDIVVLCNPDVRLDPKWLTYILEVMKSDGSIAASGGKYFDYNDPSRQTEVNRSGRVSKESRPYDIAQEVTLLCGAALAIRRSIFKQIGGFDTSYFMYHEESDWCWRARLAGFKCVYVPRAITYHPEHGGGLLASERKDYLNARNWMRSVIKNCGTLILPVYLLGLPIRIGLFLIQFILGDMKTRRASSVRIVAYALATRDTITRIRAIYLQRITTQKLRKKSDRELMLYNLWISFDYFLGGAIL